MPTPIRVKGRELKPHKAVVHPQLGARTVLTNSPWNFVSLWLKRENEAKALFYWDQARIFNAASVGLPTQSAPLLHYYSFMNAAKALLVARKVPFIERHGVKAHNMRGASKKISLSNEGVRIEQQGILPALSAYLGDTELVRSHSLQDLLFNLPFVHRTYCLTYTTQVDMYAPITNPSYVADTATGQGYFQANLSKDFASRHVLKRLPAGLVPDPAAPDMRGVRSAASVAVARPRAPTAADLRNIRTLHTQLRQDLQYINGAQTLWYIKMSVNGPRRLRRSPLPVTLATMHRLSELCRYRPVELSSFLTGQKNWLLSEFIELAPFQFFDEISAEITGHQLLIPNVRPAT